MRMRFWRNQFLLYFVVFMLGLAAKADFSSSQTDKFEGYGPKIDALVRQAQYAAALELAKAMADAARAERGETSLAYASAVSWMGYLYQTKGEIAEAIPHFERAVKIYERLGDEIALGIAVNNLGTIRGMMGQDAEAEQLYKRAISILEGKNALAEADALINLAQIYNGTGRTSGAVPLIARALKNRGEHLPAEHPLIASTFQSMAVALEAVGKVSEAETLLRKALSIRRKSQTANHPELTGVISRLGQNLYLQQRFQEADRLFREAIKLREESPATSPIDAEATLKNYALNLMALGRLQDTERTLQRCLNILQEIYRSDHPTISSRYALLAEALFRQEHFEEALTASRKSTKLLETDRLTDIDRLNLERHLSTLWRVYQKASEADQGALVAEALDVAQRLIRTETGDAIARLGARFAANDPALREKIKQNENLEFEQRAADRQFIGVLALDASQRAGRDILLRNKLADIAGQRARLESELKSVFPDYFELIRPRRVQYLEVSNVVRQEEAIVLICVGRKETFVFVITKEGAFWQRVSSTIESLDHDVSALRSYLDRLNIDSVDPDKGLFDLGLAHKVYADLFGVEQPHFAAKQHLIFIPSGPLTSLPFQLLVERPTEVSNPKRAQLETLRHADWLIRNHAISVLPTLSSLLSLRIDVKALPGDRPLIGFADPVFNKNLGLIAQRRLPSTGNILRSGPLDSYNSFWRDSTVNPEALGRLPPLPDTAEELAIVARAIGATGDDLMVGGRASETNVKQMNLAAYHIVYFATHGLVAGPGGSGEPGLALSAPEMASPLDDGVLTASEIAQLRLNADWVVLSACNTASGSEPGADGLSGLARAFFHAGARALLVSHWAVISRAAARLTTSTFEIQASRPNIGRAEALREAMLSVLDDPTSEWNAHPAIWAPFSIVGDGAR